MIDRVLITGASGFIGYHLVKAAQEAGLEVHAAVRPSSDVTRLKELNPIFVHADFSSQESLTRLLENAGYSFIIHAAGATRAKSEKDYNLVNAEYTLHLAEAALKAYKPLKKFVFMSSLAAVGPVSGTLDQITESTPPAPVTRYGKSKLLAETYLNAVKGLNITTIRPTAVYGPGEKDLFILFKTLSRRLDIYIGNNPQRLSFVYVKDLADATILAMMNEEIGNHVYNISDGNAYDRYALADEFNELYERKALRLHVPYALIRMIATFLDFVYKSSRSAPVLSREKLNELTAPNWVTSINAAKKELNYQPRFNLKMGLAETIKWYKEHHWL
jgi:nucleoside-diphosphate-sugar epimerase